MVNKRSHGLRSGSFFGFETFLAVKIKQYYVALMIISAASHFSSDPNSPKLTFFCSGELYDLGFKT